MKQILITILIAILSASLTANYFLWERAETKTLQVEPIDYVSLK